MSKNPVSGLGSIINLNMSANWGTALVLPPNSRDGTDRGSFCISVFLNGLHTVADKQSYTILVEYKLV